MKELKDFENDLEIAKNRLANAEVGSAFIDMFIAEVRGMVPSLEEGDGDGPLIDLCTRVMGEHTFEEGDYDVISHELCEVAFAVARITELSQ